jgi:hypothetical protein
MNIDACPVAAPHNIMPFERGFDAYVAEVLQPIVDGADDKDALIDWLNWQLDEWEIEAERPNGTPYAPRVVDAIGQALVRIDAADEGVSARHRAKHGLMQQIAVLETAVGAEDLDEAAKVSEQVLAGIKGLVGAPAISLVP